MRTDGFRSSANDRSKAQALLFYAFDVLIYRGRSLVELPLSTRREVLSEDLEGINATPICLSETLDATPAELVRVAKEFGFEGIVAKRRDSLYESGKRSGAWVKYKVNRGHCHGGYTPGNPIDALIVGYCEGDRLMLCRQGKERVCDACPP